MGASAICFVLVVSGAIMQSKVILCRTRLEEAASHLRELATMEGHDTALHFKAVTALDYVEKAINLLRPDNTRDIKEA
jgi:hypothetical protein